MTRCPWIRGRYHKGDPAAPAPARVPHAWLAHAAPDDGAGGGEGRGAEPVGPAEPPFMGALAERAPSRNAAEPVPASARVAAGGGAARVPGHGRRLLFLRTDGGLRPCARATACAAPSWTAAEGAGRRTKPEQGALRRRCGRVGEQAGPPRGPVGASSASSSSDWWRSAPDPSRGTRRRRRRRDRPERAQRARVRSPWTCRRSARCASAGTPRRRAPSDRRASRPAADGRSVRAKSSPACGWFALVEPDRRRSDALASSRTEKLERDGGSRTQGRERRPRAPRRGLKPLGDEDDASPPVPESSPPRHAGAPARARARARVRGRCRRSTAPPVVPGALVPAFCHVELDLHRVFAEYRARGGPRCDGRQAVARGVPVARARLVRANLGVVRDAAEL